MPVAPKAQVLYRRNGDISFGWVPLDSSIAKAYNLYASPTSAGIYVLLKLNIPNIIDKTTKKVCIFVKDSDVPIVPPARYFFKLTYIDPTNVESNINLSPFTIVFPADVMPYYENEAREANSHEFAWDETDQRWQKLLITPDGKLMVDATFSGGISTKIATLPDGTTLEYILVDNNRRTVVSEDPSVFSTIKTYNDVSVAPNSETIILTYTNASVFYLEKVVCTGTADAKFALKLNGMTIAILRNSWNNRNVTFDFNDKSLYCAAGTIVTVTALQTEKTNQDYQSNLAGFTYSY